MAGQKAYLPNVQVNLIVRDERSFAYAYHSPSQATCGGNCKDQIRLIPFLRIDNGYLHLRQPYAQLLSSYRELLNYEANTN
jgi:hypothetical protein